MPQDILEWAVDAFSGDLALACSFGGLSGMALLDMALKIDRSLCVYFIDTGLLFDETYRHIETVSAYYGIRPIAVSTRMSVEEQAVSYGAQLWKRDPDHCCSLRKVFPQREFLAKYSAWISGIRRDQSSSRAQLPIISFDRKFELIKVNPLANWTQEMVWTYIQAHGVPYNPLHDEGYPSIGCFPCTAQVSDGDGVRAGRWKDFAKTECGLHG